ncbi:hypothetical protein PXJ20_31915 [Paraburkholderia sp. A1RI_3L]|uniref:hypothetical protein n=1 Tax=Paraburkholderia TaxID=1822464 RepID=UPI003B7C3193
MKIKRLLFASLASCMVIGIASCDSGTSETQSDTKASSATEASAASEASWPKSAIVKLAQTPEEKRFLDDAGCFDATCFTAEKFDRFIVKKYPDIARIHFPVSKDLEGDKDAMDGARMDFRRGLYFAKEIRLADGESLFDLLSKCSRSFDPNNVAQIAFDPKTGKRFIFLQYFPVFVQKGTGRNTDLNLLWDRVGDELRARSPFFSTHVLVNSDFLALHGIECRSNDAPVAVDG